jgi:transmembrane sensor
MQFDPEALETPDPAAKQAALGAAHWLAVLSDENCTEMERQRFFEWLRSSTHHVDEFLRLSTLARYATRKDLWSTDSVESLVAAARASANVTALASSTVASPASPTVVPQSSWLPKAVAAGVVVAILGGLLLSGSKLMTLFDPAYTTQVGEQRSITLEDGSVVELNSRSTLRTKFTKELRAVELSEGEAIFRVAKDSKRPFRVRTGATDIVAVGTAFNVNASDARTIVTVLEGRVRVNDRTGQGASSAATGLAAHIELAVGEQLIVSPERPVVRVSLPDTDKVTSWTERRLIFEDTPISSAAAEFARYSTREIHVEDPQLGARRITGVFDATDPASLIEFLGSDESVEVRPIGNGWTVRTRVVVD